MTSFLGSFEQTYTSFTKDANDNIQHRRRNILKSKENTYKHKCKKVLNRKLKKYKLRQDGKEDQDIIDVSDTLISSLIIRSPTEIKSSVEIEIEKLRPKNYLFRMVKRKQATLKTTKDTKRSADTTKSLEKNEVLQISPSTEEKKQTNAFKLLMDSRNKSLGTNSPGKEKPIDEAEVQEIIEKKNVKVKRNLMLQKMAEQKGSQKKREVEEQHEKYIEMKMEKRAENLKNMIMNREPKTVKVKKKSSPLKVRSPLDSIETETNGKVLDKQKTLQLVSIFSETIDKKVNVTKKMIPKEDEEFLKKLSPSLKKKESMLSYFKKVEKDSESTSPNFENDNVVIKVKVGVKSKKRGRKKKASNNQETDNTSDLQEKVINSITAELKDDIDLKEGKIQLNGNSNNTTANENSKDRRKRKRETKDNIACNDTHLSKNDSNHTDDARPRRRVKKPVKYNDEVVLSSSDEELHIFTPKKKKHTENKNRTLPEPTLDKNVIQIDDETPKTLKKSLALKKKPSKDTNPSKPVKLAPIFGKPQPDQAAKEAKQKFLQSGVPEQLKKLMSKQKENNTASDTFPTVVHVQQLDSTLPAPPDFNLDEEVNLEEVDTDENGFSKILNLSTSLKANSLPPKTNASTHSILQNLKETYPRFPVYRTYKLLRGKKKGEYKSSSICSNLDNSIEILNCSIDMQTDNPDQLTWSDKYKPLSGNEIIGNFESIKELKKWLVTWTENNSKSKANKINDSDSSDYYESDLDSRDSIKSNNNLLVLSGPVGTGKTSSVYAVAAELSMKVIEVNASSKRTGKIMLQDLQEATQSHKVNRGPGSAENSQNSQKAQEIVEQPPEIKAKKRGRPKTVELSTPKKSIAKQEKTHKKKPTEVINTPASQDSSRTAMSLILIDDADIVFDQDDGFCSAIMQLVQCSKRPVILITGSLSLPHLHRFLQSSKILKMHPLLPSMLGTWLDLVCLADCGTCWPGLGAKFLNFFKGDMRKTINCLQFYVGSQEQVSGTESNSQIDSQNSDVMKLIAEDEGSCMSWADRDTIDDKNMTFAYDNDLAVRDLIINHHKHMKYMGYPQKMFNIWWSVPKILNMESNLDSKKHTDRVDQSDKNGRSLDTICSVLESISDGDYLNHSSCETAVDITSHPWYGTECNSVSELENFDCYNGSLEINNEISFELLRSSIIKARGNLGLEGEFDVDSPGMSVKRQRDRTVSRHINMTTYLSPTLDRKALALDYWSTCRAICRIEKSKTDSNSKRNNRFCHYLKSLCVLCNSDSFDSLANSLNPSGY